MSDTTQVIISYYAERTPRYLHRLLDQIYRSKKASDFSVCIVCNGGDVNPLHLPHRFNKNKIAVFNRPNSHYNIGAWDHGWRQYPGSRYFLFLQDDCFIERDNWLEGFTAKMDHDPQLGLLGENLFWDIPWKELRSSTENALKEGHFLSGKSCKRVDLYLDFLSRNGIPSSERAGHLQSLILFTSKEVLHRMNGFTLGDNSYGEAIASEIATSKKVQALGYRIAQAGATPFYFIGHREWSCRRGLKHLKRKWMLWLISKFPLPFFAILNIWDYYLLKWGVISSATLHFMSRPDRLALHLDRQLQQQTKGLVKDLCRLIKAREFEYDEKHHTMVVFSSKRTRRRQAPFNLRRIATIRYLLEKDLRFQDSEDDLLFQVTLDEMRFLIRKDIPGDATILGATFFGDGEYGFLRPYLANARVLDIGAYIGDTTVFFVRGGAQKVIAFEPHPKLYQLALKNIEINRLSEKVVLFNEGVAAKDGELCIKEDSDVGAAAGFGLSQAVQGSAVRIRLSSINRILEKTGTVDVLKMDCEGAEFEILENLSTDDLKKIKVIGLEYHRCPQPIIQKLECAGFDVKIVNVFNSNQGLLLAVLK